MLKAEEVGDMQDMFLDFTDHACLQRCGQRRVSRSRSLWVLSRVKEFGLCPEASVQKSKDCTQQ